VTGEGQGRGRFLLKDDEPPQAFQTHAARQLESRAGQMEPARAITK
jgi:hypothetical protein